MPTSTTRPRATRATPRECVQTGVVGSHQIAPEEAGPFDCTRTPLRHPKETKGEEYHATTEVVACCEPGDCC